MDVKYEKAEGIAKVRGVCVVLLTMPYAQTDANIRQALGPSTEHLQPNPIVARSCRLPSTGQRSATLSGHALVRSRSHAFAFQPSTRSWEALASAYPEVHSPILSAPQRVLTVR